MELPTPTHFIFSYGILAFKDLSLFPFLGGVDELI